MAKDKNGNGEGSIFQLKDGTWRGFITLGFDSRGKQIKKWKRGKTRREVAEKLNKIAAQAGSHLITIPERITLTQWLERYTTLRSTEVRPSTRSSHQHYLSIIKPKLGHLLLHKLQSFHVSEFYAQLASSYSLSVRRHLHHYFKAAMEDAFKQRLIERNPLTVIRTPQGEIKPAAKVWSAEEVKTFLLTADEDRLFPLFYLLLAIGARIGEVLALRWSDINAEKIEISRTMSMVRGKLLLGPPKTKRGNRTIYLSTDILDTLKRRKEDQDLEKDVASRWGDTELVFSTSVGTLIGPNNIRRSFYRLSQKAGVPKIRVHDLRHTYITLARDSGIDAEVVADRVGQDVSVTMKIYSQITEARKRKAAKNLKELLDD